MENLSERYFELYIDSRTLSLANLLVRKKTEQEHLQRLLMSSRMELVALSALLIIFAVAMLIPPFQLAITLSELILYSLLFAIAVLTFKDYIKTRNELCELDFNSTSSIQYYEKLTVQILFFNEAISKIVRMLTKLSTLPISESLKKHLLKLAQELWGK